MGETAKPIKGFEKKGVRKMILTVIGVLNMCSDCKEELRESWVENPDGTVQKIYSCGCVLSKEEAELLKKPGPPNPERMS